MNNHCIRTITAFNESSDLDSVARLMKATGVFENNDIKVRTRRVSFEERTWDQQSLKEISAKLKDIGIWGFSTSFSNPLDPDQYESAMNVIKHSENGFVNFRMCENKSGLDTNKVEPVIEFIREVSKDDLGINNFRVGVSFGVDRPTPFFPFSSMKKGNSFAVGLEYVNLVLEIIERHNRQSLARLSHEIKEGILTMCRNLMGYCTEIENETGMEFLGFDLSLAPYPYPLEEQSIVDIIEELGNVARSRGDLEYRFGESGSLFLHTFLTNILKELDSSSEIPTTGFNGVMYSVLEDTRLSQRFASGGCSVSDLLLTATTCGCGIDMLPIVSRGSKKTMASMIFDIFALSSTLDKPLGFRVLPIPQSRPGDWTAFKHLFFTNTVVADHGTGLSYNHLPAQTEDSVVDLTR